ncbi:hypothetical protein LJ656_06130 [Paraburkholderia sp. MMS20-SJTR3]|uniref:Uncharacterized protein n=1 Tax=Paraburkholderia sejongensis TaxID=2886946 RepID=A0ABS8JQK5_9BURK|nr:hypothetical protein [Paraburkholderia sp. MMS20-SJTR3]MCC8392161.1 hypothetical protein [Paraburkholderia sp. MMS20-SJTR3]
MTRRTRRNNLISTLAVFGLAGAPAISSFAVVQHGKDPMITQSDMTLWQTIDAVVQNIPLTKAKVERVLVTRVAVKDTSKNPFRNAASQFYVGGPVKLSDGVVVGKVDLRIRYKFGHPGFLVLDELGGTCITLKTVRAHYPDLTVTEYPKGQSLDEAVGFSAFLEWGKLSFGFVERNPDCLAHVAFDPKTVEDNASHQ